MVIIHQGLARRFHRLDAQTALRDVLQPIDGKLLGAFAHYGDAESSGDSVSNSAAIPGRGRQSMVVEHDSSVRKSLTATTLSSIMSDQN